MYIADDLFHLQWLAGNWNICLLKALQKLYFRSGKLSLVAFGAIAHSLVWQLCVNSCNYPVVIWCVKDKTILWSTNIANHLLKFLINYLMNILLLNCSMCAHINEVVFFFAPDSICIHLTNMADMKMRQKKTQLIGISMVGGHLNSLDIVGVKKKTSYISYNATHFLLAHIHR